MFSISYGDLVKFSYFAKTTERGDMGLKEAQRHGVQIIVCPEQIQHYLIFFQIC
jgi:hypothetical protein